MTKVVIDNSVSLDGYVAGPNDGPENPLGDNGMSLHNWFFSGNEAVGYNTNADGSGFEFKTDGANTQVVKSTFDNVGTIIFGRRTYDITNGWGGNFTLPVDVVILTHNPPSIPEGSTSFHFLDNIVYAVELAKKLAQERGSDKFVSLGGGSPGQQALNAGLVDEINLHIAPILLGGGVGQFDNLERQFTLDPLETIEGPGMTHVRYKVNY
jgi:dihydrofolate reductase